MTLLGGAPKVLAESHVHPGDISIDDSSGRLDRNTPGDADNDGYNETRGAYQIVAKGRRLTFRITPPAGGVVTSPVFELKNLAGSAFSVMIEGRLFQTAWRIDPETVLVVLPITIDRPIELTVKEVSGKASAN